MQNINFSDTLSKYKNKNKILFSRDSVCLKELLELIRQVKHRTLVLWAFHFIDEIKIKINNEIINNAIYLCQEWAKGNEKMPKAKKALLEVHALSKNTNNVVPIAKLHAIGQGLATVHVETHAIGLAIYELTGIVLEKGITNFQDAVMKRVNDYISILNQCNKEINNHQWADFLLNDNVVNKELLLFMKKEEKNGR